MGECGRRPGEGSVADRTALLGGLRLLATNRHFIWNPRDFSMKRLFPRRGIWRLDICGTEKRGWPSPVASRHPLPQGEGEQSMGVWLKPRFHAMPLELCHETSVCTLEVSALIRGSLPRPWGEGGRRPGEGVNLLVMFQHLSLLPG